MSNLRKILQKLDEASQRRVEATGDCYEAAFEWVFENCLHFMGASRKGDKDIFLVHGEVGGQGHLEGIRYGHAWIEDGDQVIDQSNGRDLRMSKERYYALGRVEEADTPSGVNLHRYTPEEVRRKAVETQIYGPWDLETSSGY